MSSTDNHTIVVGVDGSNASVRALVWAMQEAVKLELDVEVLTAWPAHRAPMVHEVPGHFNESRNHAVVAQRQVVSQAESELGRLPHLTERLENRPPLEALLDASSTSRMLVVGSRHSRRHQFGVESQRLVDRCFDAASCSVAVVDEGGSVLQRPDRTAGARVS
jgi:hypothetical protein